MMNTRQRLNPVQVSSIGAPHGMCARTHALEGRDATVTLVVLNNSYEKSLI